MVLETPDVRGSALPAAVNSVWEGPGANHGAELGEGVDDWAAALPGCCECQQRGVLMLGYEFAAVHAFNSTLTARRAAVTLTVWRALGASGFDRRDYLRGREKNHARQRGELDHFPNGRAAD